MSKISAQFADIVHHQADRRRQVNVRPISLNHDIDCLCETCMRLTVHARFATRRAS
jgi:hypothetical protein